MFECAVNYTGGRTTENVHPPNHYGRSAHEKNLCQTGPEELADVWEFLAQNNITMLPHPLYSPDLASCDFVLFPKLKTHLKGHYFGTAENVQATATRPLNISSEDFLHCYEEWQQRWNHCIRSQGAYFEGDKL
jgi:transposase